MLFLAASVGEPQVHEFDVLIFDKLEYLFWGHCLSSKQVIESAQKKVANILPKKKKPSTLLENQGLHRQPFGTTSFQTKQSYNSNIFVVSMRNSRRRRISRAAALESICWRSECRCNQYDNLFPELRLERTSIY